MPQVHGPAGSPLPRLKLGSDDDHAAFSFEAINLSAPSRVRYQFKLDGYESEWSPVTTADQAYYPKLPPGDFEFRVRATRDGRAWFEAPQGIRLRVLAPVWRRGWFQALGLLATALLLYGGHRTAVSRLRAHQRELQAEVQERERAEQGLRESETRFRTLAETSVSAIFTYGEDDRFSYVNPALERISGYTADELLGRRLWDLLPPGSQRLVEDRRAARERGERRQTATARVPQPGRGGAL
jgi:PAS domain S-box-containing protein